ncbi:MAG: IPT/TIG domain-containing protein, partial [Bacteroidetes bacterium]|nr:IPT/TIG domain-containing protein [Bacteroidota bacterium]
MKTAFLRPQTLFLALMLPAALLTGCHKENSETPDTTPAISGLLPDHGQPGTTVSISGKNLDAGMEVYFGNVKATDVTFVDNAHINAKVPADAINSKVSIRKSASTYSYDSLFTVTNTWMKRNEGFGGTSTFVTGIYFLYNNKIYLGWGLNDKGTYMDSFKTYDLAANTWSKGPALPQVIGKRYYLTALQKGNLVYLGGGIGTNSNILSDFWELDPSKTGDAACRQLADLPEAEWGCWSYLQNGKINVSPGVNNKKLFTLDLSVNSG